MDTIMNFYPSFFHIEGIKTLQSPKTHVFFEVLVKNKAF